jgi:hypothetical protein
VIGPQGVRCARSRHGAAGSWRRARRGGPGLVGRGDGEECRGCEGRERHTQA